MKHLKLFFALFAMLALGVGNVWGEEVTFNFKTIAQTSGTTGGISWETGKTGSATATACNSTNGLVLYGVTSGGGYFQTTSPTSGVITNVNIVASPKKNTPKYTIYGSTDGSTWTEIESNITISSNNTTKDHAITGSYTYFKIANTTAATAQLAITTLTITYETSGGETPDPTPSKLSTPANLKEASITETSATLSWDAVAHASNYSVTINGNTETATTNSYSATGLTAGTEYTWSVVAKGDGTNYTDSEAAQHTFTTTAATTPDPEPGTGGEETWTLVTNASDLKAGDIIVIASNTKGFVASSTITSSYMEQVNSTFSTDKSTITTLPAEAAQLTIGGTSGAWTLTYDGKQLGATAVKKVAWDNGTMTWSITIADDGGATIQNGTNTYGRFLHNVSSTRFTTYTSNVSSSMLLPQIYKKVTTTDEPGTEETAASLTANPTSLDFGNVTQNNEVEAKTFTISGSDFTTGELTITAPSGYTVNPTTVSVDGTLGETTITVTPNTSTVGTFNGNVTISGANLKSSVNVALTMTVEKAPATPTDNVYVKVTSTEGITDGEYLIVYEDETAPVAFNGALATLDAAKNTVAVGISNSTIAGNTDIDAALFTIDVTAGTLKSASGKYIGVSSNSNGLKTEDVAKDYKNAFSVDDNGNAVIAADFEGSTMSLRYNNTAGDNNLRFRYYKNAGQQPIALYKKASEHIVTIATCTNGSVVASVVDGAKVLSGTTVTLENTPATGYKLTAYDVYKTGEEVTKVTVADDNTFIMPEFDVTISATFELAKTLTGIEITTPATQTTFWQGETFNSTGLKVTAHFDGAADEDVTDKVTVTGSTATAGTQTVSVSFKEGEVTKTTTYNITVKAIPNTKETAYTVADAYDIIDKLTTAEGVFIKGIVSQVDEYLSNYKSITYWISDDGTTTKQLQAYSGKGLEGADFVDINGVSIEDQVIVCGNLKKHTDGTYEFNYNNYLVSQIKTTKADPELSYTPTEYNVNLGDAFTAPTLNNPHTLAVTYSSNNEDVATVAADGAVTIKAAGTVTITASFAGDENYVAGEASYTINVTDPSVSSVTFDAAVDIPTEGLILTKNGISMEFTAGTMNNGEEYRCNAGKTMTISYTDGFITKVVLNCLANGTTKYGPGCFTTTIGSYSYEEKVGTWTGEAKSVVFTSGQQVRMTTVTVYYKQDKRANSELAWSEETISLTVGDAFTAPTFSNPNSLEVSFESSNTELATVDNAGVISLVSGKTGTATITATYAGDENYKAAEVTCVITVSPKSEKVVILAQYNGQWYALKAAYFSTNNNRLAAIPVNYVGGKLYNVAEADKATIEWQLAMNGAKATFKNGDNYLTGTDGTDLTLSTTAFEWDYDGELYLSDGGTRTFIYHKDGYFRNYATSNAIPNSTTYSYKPVVASPVYATGDIVYTREGLTAGKFGTICLPYGSTKYSGATFFEIAYKETGKVYIDEVTTLEAGVPYIFQANSSTLTVTCEGTPDVAKSNNGLYGTFIKIADVAAHTSNTGYILTNNLIRFCEANCNVPANRAYIVLDEISTTKKPMPQGRRRVGMNVEGENVETGVEDIITTDAPIKVIENGQLIIIRDGVKYNVQGQKL